MAIYCYNCGSEITWKRRRIVHVNICQNPSITYFCNQDCKLNWIFKRPNIKLEKNSNDNWVNQEVKSIFDMDAVEKETDELVKYLKDNNLRILREA
ncbi:MAG: hypothetical protein EU529_06735 [Promethearchaeota archaeon]|nr:MAG: hypothetical protein EU529_06735 [Candidatus Lokiarchaeota archaeon]